MTKEKPDVDAAYALKTPQDSQRLYAGWASTYDNTFARRNDFLMPAQVAELFASQGGRGPVLDAGAGTGLVAEAILKHGPFEIDAFDITAEMLETARAKGVYRRLIRGDLTRTLPFPEGTYRAVVSSGTFTHGHVGPEALDELIRVAARDALFVLTIKADHYAARGFADRFELLTPRISNFGLEKRPIYGAGATGAHARDEALIAVFRKA